MNEAMTKLAAEADALIEREHFIPALIKSAVANGVPQPQTQQDVMDILEVVNIQMQAKQALANGDYPELRRQFASRRDFGSVRDMAKKAKQDLDTSYGRKAVNPALYDVFGRMEQARRAAAN